MNIGGWMKMKKFILILCVLVAIIIIFKACTLKSMKDENGTRVLIYFPKPEKILIYKDGNVQTVAKDSKLFSDIVIKMNSRVYGGLGGSAGLAFNKESMENMKKNEIVVEFIYSKKQKLKGAGPSREYSSLIFPLTGKYYDLCFLEGDNNDYSGPVGRLMNIGDVLELVK
jgi:hypothetical protein